MIFSPHGILPRALVLAVIAALPAEAGLPGHIVHVVVAGDDGRLGQAETGESDREPAHREPAHREPAHREPAWRHPQDYPRPSPERPYFPPASLFSAPPAVRALL